MLALGGLLLHLVRQLLEAVLYFALHFPDVVHLGFDVLDQLAELVVHGVEGLGLLLHDAVLVQPRVVEHLHLDAPDVGPPRRALAADGRLLLLVGAGIEADRGLQELCAVGPEAGLVRLRLLVPNLHASFVFTGVGEIRELGPVEAPLLECGS